MNACRHLALVAASSLALLAIGCKPQPPATAPDTRAADEAAVRAADEAWSQSAKSGQVEQMLAAYAPDAVVLAPNAPMTSDEAGRRKMMTDLFASPGFALSWQVTKVETARSGDLAYSLGTYELSMNDASGKPMTDHGKYTTIWRKQADGSWKAIVDMFNTDLPAQPPAAAESTATEAPKPAMEAAKPQGESPAK
jgi:ketosteroid isomerase-like protein